MTNRVVLVRHGQSTGNADGSFYKHNVDAAVCLTQLGVSQALHAGQKLDELRGHLKWPWHGVLAFTSEYTRAQQTGRIVLDKMGLKHIDMTITPAINERMYGDNDTPPDWHKNAYAVCSNGESLLAAQARFNGWWATMEPNLSQRDIVLFCHGEIMKSITATLLNLSPTELVKVSTPNAVPVIFERTVDSLTGRSTYNPSIHTFKRYDDTATDVIH